MFGRSPLALFILTALCSAPATTWAEPSKDAAEIRPALKAMERWKGMAEKHCLTTFEVWVDLAPHAAYKYTEEFSRKKLLGTGFLGVYGTNLFNELRGVCRTFSGNKPSTCVPKLKPFTKVVFKGHPKLDAKNTDIKVTLKGDTLTLVHPATIQWQSNLVAKTLYEKLSCDGNEPAQEVKDKAKEAQKKAAAAKPKLVKGDSLREAAKAYKRWKGMAENDCETTFEVWVDVAPYDVYKYAEGTPRKKLIGSGGLGLFITNWFNEMRGACRTFSGNKPTTCVPVLKKFKKLVFRPHSNIEAKNTDVALTADGETLTMVYPPAIQWQSGIMAKTLYEKFSCSGSEAQE